MGLTVAAKFWIAVLFLAANVIRSRYGIDLGMEPQMANDIVQGVGAAFIWLIPNKSASTGKES